MANRCRAKKRCIQGLAQSEVAAKLVDDTIYVAALRSPSAIWGVPYLIRRQFAYVNINMEDYINVLGTYVNRPYWEIPPPPVLVRICMPSKVQPSVPVFVGEPASAR